MDTHHKLAHSPVFEDLTPQAVNDICARGQLQSFELQQQLFARGQDARHLMILEEGVVELFFPVSILGARREVILESRQAGDVVAWSALVEPFEYTLSARAAGPCVVCCLCRDDLHDYFTSAPESGYLFMRNLARVIGSRLHSIQTMWTHDLESALTNRME